MGQRIIYFGPLNNNYKKTFIDKGKEYLKENKGDKFYYILPTGNLLTRYRSMLLEDLKGVFDINVITFDDIVEKLLSKELYIHIDDATKETIIGKIVKELSEQGNIDYYKGLIESEGFINSLSYIIGELKRSLILPKDFYDNIPRTPRFIEIAQIYEKYQLFLDTKGLVDKEEYFIKSLEKLQTTEDLFSELDFVIIDEFFDFRPQELEILKSLCKFDIDIYVNIPYKTSKNWTIVQNTIDILKDMGFRLEEVDGKGELNYFENISEDLFVNARAKYEQNDKLKLIKAPNKYLEIKKICEEIKRLHNKGVNLQDIGIVVENINFYKEVLIKTFREEKIPCTLNEEIKLIDIPLIKEIVNILELNLSKYDQQMTAKVLKSGYLDICDGNNRDRLEYMFHNLKIKNTVEEYKDAISSERKRLNYHIKNDQEKREVYEERLEDIANLNFVIMTLIEKVSQLPTEGASENFIQGILKLLHYYDLEEGIKSVYKITKDYSILQRDVMALSKFKQILERVKSISELAYENNITIREFYNILTRLLSDETIIIAQRNTKGVSILTPSTARGLRYRALFILGLTQGEYPYISDNNWFFRDEDYQMFKDMGLDIKTYKEKLDKESLLFTVAITRPTDILVLSYPESTNGADVSIPSMFLDELLNLFKGENIKDKIDYTFLTMDYLLKEKIEDTTHERELLRHLLYNHYLGKDIKEYLKMIDNMELNEIVDRITCEIRRYEREFNEYDGLIGDEKIRQDIINYFKDKKFSISQLETYAKCPFRFLYERLLKVEGIEREIEEFSALDRGNIYHEVLAIYYKNHVDDFREHIVNGNKFDVESTGEEVADITRQVINNYGISKLNKIWELRIEMITRKVISLVKADLSRLEKYKIKLLPHEFEVKFGYNKDFVVKIGDMEVKLMGKIDRIDKEDEENVYIVYDYKHSGYGLHKMDDMIEGLSLQLPVYIMSQMDKDREVIGGGYIVIKDNKMPIKLLKESMKSSLKKRKSKEILSDEDWNKLIDTVKEKICEYVKGIFSGDFRLNPVECDTFCTLASVCRYNKERIVGKDDGCEIN